MWHAYVQYTYVWLLHYIAARRAGTNASLHNKAKLSWFTVYHPRPHVFLGTEQNFHNSYTHLIIISQDQFMFEQFL